jgi:hypothetical protein
LHLVLNYKLQTFLFLFLTTIYFGKSWLKPYPLSGDEPSYLMDAISIGLFQSRQSKLLYTDENIVTSIYPSPILYAHVIGDSNVTYHGVGLALFLLPAAFLASKVLIAKLIVSVIAAAAITVTFDLATRISNTKYRKLTLIIFILIGLSPPVLFNAALLYPEFLCTLLLIIPINIICRKIQSKSLVTQSLLILMTLYLNFIGWLNTRYIPLSIAALISLAVYFSWNKNILMRNTGLKKIFLVIGSVTTFNAIFMVYCFDIWYGTKNLFFVSQLQPSGLRAGDFAAIYRTAGTYVFGHAEGLVPWAPFLLFAIPGMSILWLRFRLKIFYFLFPIGIYFGTIIQAAALGGSTPPNHYTALLVPFLGIPITLTLIQLFSNLTGSQIPNLSLEKRETRNESLKYVQASSFVLLLALSIWSLVLSTAGVKDEGLLYMRSASQESPILPIAKVGYSFWPHYLSPNKDNGSLGVPPLSSWNKGINGNWETVLSQGFRSAGAYESTLDLKSNSASEIKVNFEIGINSNSGISKIVERVFYIRSGDEKRISLPFQFYETSEITWRIETNSKDDLNLMNSNLVVLDQQRPSGFTDLGFTFLAILLSIMVFRNELKIQKSKINHLIDGRPE